jgi:hypothetical protein
LTRFIKTRSETKKKDSLHLAVNCKPKFPYMETKCDTQNVSKQNKAKSTKKRDVSQNKSKPDHVVDTNGMVKENKPPNQRKCSYHNCKGDAIGSYTIDLDINGFGYCKKHKNDIQSALLWTIIGVEELAENSMGIPNKNKRRSSGSGKPRHS